MSIAWTSALFKKIQARYGTKWVASIEGIEELAIKEWSAGLKGLSGAQIKHGLDSLEGEWPPSLPEFKRACMGVKDWRLQGGSQCEALPKPEISPEQLEKYRKELLESVEAFRKTNNEEQSEKFISDPVKQEEIRQEFIKMGILEE